MSWFECVLIGIACFVAMQVFGYHPESTSEGLLVGCGLGLIVATVVAVARR